MIGGLRYGDPEQIGEPEFEDDARSFDESRGSAPRLWPHARSKLPLPLRFRRPLAAPHHLRAPDRHRSRAAHRSCIAGARARPPEDVGGTSGYANFLEIVTIPVTPTWRDLDLVRRSLDSEAFNLDRTNREVAAALRANRQIRRRQ